MKDAAHTPLIKTEIQYVEHLKEQYYIMKSSKTIRQIC